ncbi:hybrid sensor histidine kinase/response regulator [Anaerolentibacter hominis]|uniref:hybrid sensor histidine kinase/response regulator n=1 Tax=Anaerolentibacter hominis TaxID=3079009 RepID=UPI0031B828BC
MRGDNLSMDLLTAVLDNAPVAVYVSGINDWKLLYVNRLASKLFSRGAEEDEITCFQAVGFDKPCPFCRMGKLSRSELMVREFKNPVNGRVYQLSGKLIDWAGQPAHIEYVVDITEKKKKEEQSRELEEKLQSTFSSIPCGLCVYRFDGERISPVFHNPAFYQIMGYSGEHIAQLEQRTDFLGVHPEDLELLKRNIQDAIRTNGMIRHTYRLWNDTKEAYCWIRLEGSVKPEQDKEILGDKQGGTKLMYGVYTDVSEQRRLEQELTDANDKMQDIVNAIPGGVAIYKVSDIFETVYFSDGVPALTGYSAEEYQELIKQDAAEMTYWEDTPMVVERARRVISTHEIDNFEFRKQHRDGHIVWVRAQVKWIGEDAGCPLLHCVFHNISDLKEAQLEMDHLVNSIPGGIASYRVEGERFIPTFYSDGLMKLSDHTREEYDELTRCDAMNIVYEQDRERVMAAARAALLSGETLDISYRIRHKNGKLIWIHLNGRRMGPLSESTRFYAVFTGMSAETRLFQSIANETADGIYVIDKASYDLLYVNESRDLFTGNKECVGQKCYAVLQGRNTPCEFCSLIDHAPDGEEHEMRIPGSERFYSTRFRETDWNGIAAYVKFVRDITEEVTTRREKERLEQYFQNVLKNLPGGVVVVHYNKDGSMRPEFLSDGFAAMTGMTLEEAWRLYREDAMAGVHPDDQKYVNEQMAAYVESGDSHCELVYRLKKGAEGYVWIRNNLTMIQNEGGEGRVYAVFRDITREREEQIRLRQQYKDLLMQHYHTHDPNTLVLGHCNITGNKILEINDYTDSDLLKTFGSVREAFFTGMSGLVVEDEERRAFLGMFLNKPALAAFERGDTERKLECFIQLPKETIGRYAQIKMNLVAAPDSGDVTGILTVTDITEQTISNRILQQITAAGYDFVADLDLVKDRFTILSSSGNGRNLPPVSGCHSRWVEQMLADGVVPRDRERYRDGLETSRMLERLQKESSYTFAFSAADANGDIWTKNITVSAVDLRLGRVCLARADITDSVREQQGLLRVISYTFEMAGFINMSSKSLTMYTRETVLNNLPPLFIEKYETAIPRFVEQYCAERNRQESLTQFEIRTMTETLAEKPDGYDFLFHYQNGENERYKQINVMWGDVNHRTICLVRADVTDMLAAERKTKRALENALALAEEANRAKSDFLSAMSHDIRTPMNAIMGMTTLAAAHLGEKKRVEDCLRKISVSSRHLLSLINDILDMSKIERSQITLNNMKLYLPDLLSQLTAIIVPQAEEAGLVFTVKDKITHEFFYGDGLRINQILINILSNAVKYTPEGGSVDFLVEEIQPSDDTGRTCYRFTVKDTGVGMTEEFMAHLFEPFTRSQSTARIEGTGLGLSITKGLVDLMDGRISVESHPHRGTRFQVELGCEYAENGDRKIRDTASMEADARDSGLFAGRRFLIAEDNAINAEILTELLEMYGADCTVKTDGSQVVRAFREADPGTYDGILMDIQMPEMNGYEATRAIRKLNRPDAGAIPIIAMTANAFAEDVQAALNAGMNAHVAKPVDMAVLQETLMKVLR